MTPLDQAFIRAYARQAATPLKPPDGPQPATCEAVPSERGPQKAIDAPVRASGRPLVGVSDDALMRAIHQPHRDHEPQAERISSAAPAGVAKAADRKPAPTAPPVSEEPSVKSRPTQTPTLDGLDLSGIAYRLDAPAGDKPARQAATPAELAVVPPPHLDKAGNREGAKSTGGAAAKETADPQRRANATTSATNAGEVSGGPFTPMLQVEGFVWPKICGRLRDAAADELDRLGHAIHRDIRRGRKVLAIAGCRRGEGATTMLLCIARRLIRREMKVVLVDANRADPMLAKSLGLLPEHGWEDVLSGQLPLEEVVVESIDGSVAILPLCRSEEGGQPASVEPARIAEHLQTLRRSYDAVLIDLGPWESSILTSPSPSDAIVGVDAVVVVHNVASTAASHLDELQRRLAKSGIAPTGIVQNFVDAAT